MIRSETTGAVTVITLDRARRKNAVDREHADALAEAFRAFEADDDALVAVLHGAGGCFCAGADLQAVAAGEPNRLEIDGDGPMGPTRLELSKPTIAAIEGYAVAGGLELALWCDLRIAANDAVLGVFCRRWGVPLIDGGTLRLPRVVGLGRALDLVLTGRPVHADEALSMGLVNRIVPAADLMAETRAYADDLARRAPLAQQAAKEVVLASYGRALEDALKLESRSFHDLGRSADLVEGTAAFREKRDAVFKGR